MPALESRSWLQALVTWQPEGWMRAGLVASRSKSSSYCLRLPCGASARQAEEVCPWYAMFSHHDCHHAPAGPVPYLQRSSSMA